MCSIKKLEVNKKGCIDEIGGSSKWFDWREKMKTVRGLGYKNPEADKLVKDAARETDKEKRQALYQDLQMDPFFKPTLEKAGIEE